MRNHLLAIGSDVSPAPIADDLVVTGAYYDATGHPDAAASFCLQSDPSVCGSPNNDPFVQSSEVLAISPCRLRGFASRATVDLVVTDEGKALISIPVPPALDTRFAARETNGMIHVTAYTSRPLDQAVVWLGLPNEQRVMWTSEDAVNAGTITATHVDIKVPREAIEKCAGCKIVAQVAMLSEHDGIGVYSEDRATIVLERRSRENQDDGREGASLEAGGVR